MKAEPTSLAGAILISLKAFGDSRGFFKETFVKSKYAAIGIHDDFVQDSMSISARNVLRGLHSDPQMSKLVQVLRGTAYDVIVDTRADSKTFGMWQGFELSEHNHLQLYIPHGFLHGFLSLTDDVLFCYKQSAEYAPQRELAVRYDDRDLNIAWPCPAPNVSAKDLRNPRFSETFKSSV